MKTAFKLSHFRWLAILAATSAIVLILGFTRTSFPTPSSELVFRFIDGQQTTLKEQHGQSLIVTFWATTCTICMEEMPDWQALYQRHHAQGLQLIAVAMPYDRADWILHFAKRFEWQFPIALDPLGEVTRAFGDVSLTPTTFVIDPDGIIQQKITGRVDFATLQNQIANWL